MTNSLGKNIRTRTLIIYRFVFAKSIEKKRQIPAILPGFVVSVIVLLCFECLISLRWERNPHRLYLRFFVFHTYYNPSNNGYLVFFYFLGNYNNYTTYLLPYNYLDEIERRLNFSRGISNPAAFLCPPPPNRLQIADTSKSPTDRNENLTNPFPMLK